MGQLERRGSMTKTLREKRRKRSIQPPGRLLIISKSCRNCTGELGKTKRSRTKEKRRRTAARSLHGCLGRTPERVVRTLFIFMSPRLPTQGPRGSQETREVTVLCCPALFAPDGRGVLRPGPHLTAFSRADPGHSVRGPRTGFPQHRAGGLSGLPQTRLDRQLHFRPRRVTWLHARDRLGSPGRAAPRSRPFLGHVRPCCRFRGQQPPRNVTAINKEVASRLDGRRAPMYPPPAPSLTPPCSA